MGGKCKVCSKPLCKQSRKYQSNAFCTKDCRVKYWKGRYGKDRLKLRDGVVDDIVNEYRKSLKRHPSKPIANLPVHMPRLGPNERHYGMSYRLFK